jgi:hypothetical protein
MRNCIVALTLAVSLTPGFPLRAQDSLQVRFDPETGAPLDPASTPRFDPATGLPIAGDVPADSSLQFDQKTGQPLNLGTDYLLQSAQDIPTTHGKLNQQPSLGKKTLSPWQLAGGILLSNHLQEPGLNISVSYQFPRAIIVGGLPPLTPALSMGILNGVTQPGLRLCRESFILGYGLIEGHLNWSTPKMKAALFLGGGVARYGSEWGGSGCGGKAYGAGVILSPGALIGSRQLALELRALPLPVRGKSFGRIAWIANVAYSFNGQK